MNLNLLLAMPEIKTKIIPELDEEFFEDLNMEDVKSKEDLEKKILTIKEILGKDGIKLGDIITDEQFKQLDKYIDNARKFFTRTAGGWAFVGDENEFNNEIKQSEETKNIASQFTKNTFSSQAEKISDFDVEYTEMLCKDNYIYLYRPMKLFPKQNTLFNMDLGYEINQIEK